MLLCSFALLNGSFAQKLSDQQVIQMAVKEKQAGASETEIATRLMQKGATMDQIQRIRSQYAQQITKRGLDDTVDNAIGNAQARMRTNNEPNDNAITASGGAEAPRYVPEAMSPSGKRVFGRSSVLAISSSSMSMAIPRRASSLRSLLTVMSRCPNMVLSMWQAFL